MFVEMLKERKKNVRGNFFKKWVTMKKSGKDDGLHSGYGNMLCVVPLIFFNLKLEL